MPEPMDRVGLSLVLGVEVLPVGEEEDDGNLRHSKINNKKFYFSLTKMRFININIDVK
jgi:hypothetical protein